MTLKPKYVLLALFFAFLLAPTASAQEDEGGDEAQEEQEKEPAITDYIEMDPPFVTHVGEPGTKLTYLKAAVTIRASKETTRPEIGRAHV